MRAERTFGEKATAIHVFCAQSTFRGGERFARHWHDVARLDTAGCADVLTLTETQPIHPPWVKIQSAQTLQSLNT